MRSRRHDGRGGRRRRRATLHSPPEIHGLSSFIMPDDYWHRQNALLHFILQRAMHDAEPRDGHGFCRFSRRRRQHFRPPPMRDVGPRRVYSPAFYYSPMYAIFIKYMHFGARASTIV